MQHSPFIKFEKYMLFACWSFSLLAYLVSTIAEFNGFEICKLCMFQRYIHLTLVGIIPLFFFGFLRKFLIAFVILFLSLSTVVAFYHFFIQMGFVSDICSVPHVETLEDFIHQIYSQSIPCSKITLKFLDVPIAAWNGCISLFMLISIAVHILRKYLDLKKANLKMNLSG